MEINICEKGKYSVLELKGPVSAPYDGQKLLETLRSLQKKPQLFFAVNFQETDTLCSDMINAILQTHNTVKKSGGELVLIGSNSKIMETLEVLGIPMLLSIFLDMESFEKDRLKKQ